MLADSDSLVLIDSEVEALSEVEMLSDSLTL